ncbi:MAG: YncE family protein, partial [Myxococcales bacterium]
MEWTLSGPGALSQTTGRAIVYFPPACVAKPSKATLTASAGAAAASVSITVNPAAKLACLEIEAASVEATIGDPGIALTAIATGNASQVKWSLFGPGGLSADTGAQTTYLLPPSMPVSASITVTATLDGASAHASIVVHPRPIYPVVARPVGLAFDGSNLWVANQSGPATVTKVRVSDGAVLASIGIADNPRGILFDGANVWVSHYGGTLTKIRASDGGIVGTYGIALMASSLAFDGASIWTVVPDGITRTDANDGTLLATIPVPGATQSYPKTILFDGTALWVGTQTSTISKRRISDGAEIANVWVGAPAVSLAMVGDVLWVVAGTTFVQIDTANGFVIGVQPFGLQVTRILYD